MLFQICVYYTLYYYIISFIVKRNIRLFLNLILCNK